MRIIPGFIVINAYKKVEDLICNISIFTKKWFNYQSLWDLSPEMVYSTLGLDVDRWAALVAEIQEARSMIDNEESAQYFGPVLIKHVIIRCIIILGINSIQSS